MRAFLGGFAGYAINSTMMYSISIRVCSQFNSVIELLILMALTLWLCPIIATAIAVHIAGESAPGLSTDITWVILNVITITAWIVVAVFRAVIFGIYIYLALLTLQTLLLLASIYSEIKQSNQ